jgi:uncharacterized oxidoreductase
LGERALDINTSRHPEYQTFTLPNNLRAEATQENYTQPTSGTVAIMSSSFNTILIMGGTSGIGEGIAKRYHKQGKKVIITGRRENLLAEITSANPGMESYTMDNSILADIPGHVDTLFTKYPDLDAVLINSGAMSASSIKDLSTSSDEQVIKELTVNMTAPFILARHMIPRFLSRGTEATFMITSSGLAFVPSPLAPVYNATKSGVHAYLVTLRQQLKGTKVNIIEIVPPLVSTDLTVAFQDQLKGAKALTLQQFLDEIFGTLDSNEAKDLKEVAAGTAVDRSNAWRSSIGELLKNSGMGG